MRLSVRNRIFAITLGMTTLVFGLLLAAVYAHTTRAFEDNIGRGFHLLAEQLAARIDQTIERKIDQSTALTNQEGLIAALEEANRRYQGLSPQEISREIERIDREWSTSKAYRHLYTPSLNPTARLLSRHQGLKPEEYAELFVTDAFGALVAATNRTSDYGQADEEWWQVAFNEGKGAVYVGGLEFDESAQVYSITVALPVKNREGTRTIGVLKAVLEVNKLLEQLAHYRLGETGHIHLFESNGKDLFAFGKVSSRFVHSFKPGVVRRIISSSRKYLVDRDAEGKPFIVGFAFVKTPERLGAATFGGRHWCVVAAQEIKEAYAPVYRLMKTLLGLGLLALVALYLTVVLTAKTITTPLDALRRGTQIVRDGDLGHRVELDTGDELQELAESFNEMTAKLQASHEDLQERSRELERSLDALGQSEERYRSVLETSRSGIFVCNEEGNFPIFNPSFAETLGYSVEEMKEVNLAQLVHPDDLAVFEQVRQAQLGGGQAPAALELRFLTKQGEEIIVEVSMGPYAPAGEVVGVIGELRDITKRKRAEKELKTAHQELQEAYDALKRAQAAAVVSEKLLALGRLTAGVSHEILNPLNIITMRLYLMLNDPALPEEIAAPLRILDEQAQRIVKIVQELSYFARQRPPERGPVDINETVRRTFSLVESEMQLANISTELHLDEALPLALADEDQLQQVVVNLLTNAREAMPEGGRLVLRTSALVTDKGQWVEIRVEDSGEGIKPEHGDNLFEPFFSTKPEGEGPGLGLAICKGIVDAHGGSIWAENSPEGGAVFVVRLEAGSG